MNFKWRNYQNNAGSNTPQTPPTPQHYALQQQSMQGLQNQPPGYWGMGLLGQSGNNLNPSVRGMVTVTTTVPAGQYYVYGSSAPNYIWPPVRIPGFTTWKCPHCRQEYETYTAFHITVGRNGLNFVVLCLTCWPLCSLGQRIQYYSKKFQQLEIEDQETWKEISSAVWAGK